MKRPISLGLVVAMTAALVALVAAPAGASDPVFASHKSDVGTISISGAATVAAAVNADDGAFVQLAPNASVTLAFPAGVYAIPDGTSAPDLTIHTYDVPYPADAKMSVYVKSNTNNWVSLGVYPDTADVQLNLEGVGIINEVKVDQGTEDIDPAYPTLGFDLNAVSAQHTATLAEATTDCAAGAGTYEGFVPVWSGFVSAVTATPVTTPALVDGTNYRIEARGLFSGGPAAGPGTEILADARYSQRVVGQATPADAVFGYDGLGLTLLDLLIDGASANWQGDVYNSAHTYTSDVVGSGTPATFDLNIYDIASAYGNNIGGLCVSVFEKLPVDTDGDGFLDPDDNCPTVYNPTQALYAVDFLPPFDDSSPSGLIVNKMKNGRVVPVKAVIYDICAGTYLTDPATVVTIATSRTPVVGTGDPIESYADAGMSSAGTDLFRWSADGFWIYNLDSKGLGLTVGNAYRVDVFVGGVQATTDTWAVLQPVK